MLPQLMLKVGQGTCNVNSKIRSATTCIQEEENNNSPSRAIVPIMPFHSTP